MTKQTVLLFFALTFYCVKAQSQDWGSKFNLIPNPVKLEIAPGEFIFNNKTTISSQPQHKNLVSFLENYLRLNLKLNVVCSFGKSDKQTIILTSSETDDFPDEAYKLSITPGQIIIRGKNAGIFYGIQTLLQLLPTGSTEVTKLPCAEIEDCPRFRYRGFMLDVSRHFFTTEQIKNIIDLMASYKLNRFHWHLTDDQGWRIEIKSYPKLTSVGAWRVPRVGTWNTNEPPRPGEKATYGGFYTQQEITDIVNYARERHIEILPEIDVPGHCMAAIASYPYLSCTKDSSVKVNPGSRFATWFAGGGYEMYTDNSLDPSDERVYEFLDKVFSEIAALFPYQYIHIGGDECYKGFWEKDAEIQMFMANKGIKGTKDLQSYFIKQVNQILVRKGKKLIGWDEIAEGGLPDEATVMARFIQNNQKIPKLKHDVIMTPGGNIGYYFDYAQSSSKQEPVNHGGCATLYNTYNYEPVPSNFEKNEKSYIKGIQGCMWTEHVPTISKLQYMIFPRLLALSEVAWTSPQNKNFKDFFENRIPAHLSKFDAMGYNYRVPTAFTSIDTTIIGDHFSFNLKPSVKGAKIYYTLNGLPPTDADREMNGALEVSVPKGKKSELQTIVITPSGRRSVVTHTVMYNRSPVAPVSYQTKNFGLKYRLLNGSFTTTDQLNFVLPADSGVVNSISTSDFSKLNSSYGLFFEGLVRINEDGDYSFSLKADDGARLYIDNELVVDNDKPFKQFEKNGAIPLLSGLHRIKLYYYNYKGGSSIKLSYSVNGQDFNEFSTDNLFY